MSARMWRLPKQPLTCEEINAVLDDNLANINEFGIDPEYFNFECLRGLLQHRGIPKVHETKSTLFKLYRDLEEDLKVSDAAQGRHPTPAAFFNVLPENVRKEIYGYLYADKVSRVKLNDHSVWDNRKSCVGQNWCESYEKKDWRLLSGSPINVLLVNQQWYKETRKIFWAQSMLDVAGLTYSPDVSSIPTDTELPYGKLRVDLKSLCGYQIECVIRLMEGFDEISEMSIQCRPETIKELHATKHLWRGTRLSEWDEFTAFGKDRTNPNLGLPRIEIHDIYDDTSWATVDNMKVQRIMFEPVVAIQDSEYKYIWKLMRWFKRHGLEKVEPGVKVLLPGEWIPNYDFDEDEEMLLARGESVGV